MLTGLVKGLDTTERMKSGKGRGAGKGEGRR